MNSTEKYVGNLIESLMAITDKVKLETAKQTINQVLEETKCKPSTKTK